MARDRKRAKQRRDRQARRPQPAPARSAGERERARGEDQAPADPVDAPVDPIADDPRFREESTLDSPEPLEHASPYMEEAEAALRREPPVPGLMPDRIEAEITGGEGAEVYADELTPEEIDEDTIPAQGRTAAEERATTRRERAPAGRRRQGNRMVAFLRSVVAELRRVQWPNRRQVVQATGVVLGFVVVAGAYLGLLDVVFQRVINFII